MLDKIINAPTNNKSKTRAKLSCFVIPVNKLGNIATTIKKPQVVIQKLVSTELNARFLLYSVTVYIMKSANNVASI